MSPSWAVGELNRGSDGEFVRDPSKIRDWVSADGSSGFLAEPGRYHLYVSLACPWSHRAVVVRALKGLEDAVGISYLHPYRDDRGWAFDGDGFTDELHGWDFLSTAYDETSSDYDGRISVPVLWDRETGRIVSNESADIIKMFNSEWDEWAARPDVDLYPEDLRAEIDELDGWIYANVNNAVYQAGFSRSQGAYERAYRKVFDTLPELDRRLSDRRFLLGDRLTLADWRLWVTLVRFDPVYNLHFRCNGARIIDYPNLWGYTRDLFQHDGVADTVAMDQIKTHYYTTHDELNPKRIIPAGPENFDLSAPHDRAAGSLP